ncbi:hypothetical protein [Streptomyces sp. NPDC051218]|uniref:hypothetical protein n=1 Tax=Streptomyces sp. NPDC051218 TaxID=3365645 RepID=UPI0037ABAAF0
MVRAAAPDPDLERWIEDSHRNIVGIADMLGVASDVYTSDPMKLVPALQDYVSRLPFREFEQSDWLTLLSDLMSYVSDFLIEKHGARWNVVDDATAPRGYRYVIEAEGRDGQTRRIDPADVVRVEFGNLPIEVTRMLASAELTLRLTAQVDEDE